MCKKHILLCVFIAICVGKGVGQMATYDVKLANLLLMQRGLGWPHQLNVVVGHEALLKLQLDDNLVNQRSCVLTTPTGLTFNILQPPNNRYESWSDGCGVRVKNVQKTDEGRWRLTATKGNDTITGWSEVHVQAGVPEYTGSPISIRDGESHTQVELTSLNNSYCLVSQPFSESSLVPGHCSVTLDRATRAIQGNWNVLLGIPGQVSELHVERRITVEAERLNTGYIHDTETNKVHLYCNILHTKKNITFCRFQKTSDTIGYNIVDGLGDGVHSYYGDGFLKRHCGMTIETPTEHVFGTWRCTVGVQEWVGTQIRQSTPFQALIKVLRFNLNRKIRRDFKAEETKTSTVFVQRDTSFTVMCRADISLTYCWFKHPNGSQYTPMPHVDGQEQAFWYSGESLQTGDCGITFYKASNDDDGVWTCHMGPRDQLGLEVTDLVNVRVTGPLAANTKEVNATIGANTTLYCHSSNGNRPLDYCRFLTPKFVGISLDSTVTKENAILSRFYFTPGRDLDYGECSLTIDPVMPDDVGEWTCAALLHDETLESRDTIILSIRHDYSATFRADIFGMAGGAVVLGFVLAGIAWHNRDKIRRRLASRSVRSDAMSLDEFGCESTTSRISSSSITSGSSSGSSSVNGRA
ncbi:hypothetical protein O3G_MSEX005668 [Manduca sexta]|uniref:Immunoglobulin domain-containing protein n=1 Tax=Manduca sexta TaxID=7130 RepID=A0A921YZW2_MANSE|nr:hypothetical protein O3G_MSEX005668 [Manduca sexta]